MNFLRSPMAELIGCILLIVLILALILWIRRLERHLHENAMKNVLMLDEADTRWRQREQLISRHVAQKLKDNVQQADQRLFDFVHRKEVDDIVTRSQRQNVEIEKRLTFQRSELTRILTLIQKQHEDRDDQQVHAH